MVLILSRDEAGKTVKDARIYNTIKHLCAKSGLSAHDAAAFYAAFETARESTFGCFCVGCVIVVGNKVVGSGFNTVKSDPVQKHYNTRYRDFAPAPYSYREHSLHAEIAALKSIPYPVKMRTDWSKAEAYIYRICPGLPYRQGLAAPCCACAHALADFGIRKVSFSTDYGFATSYLNEGCELL